MFNLRKYNSFGGVPARQYSTMHDSYKMPPAAGFLTNLLSNFGNVHGISSDKRFVNPNYVNKQNPNIQSCHFGENASPHRITQQCSNFLANSVAEMPVLEPRKSDNVDIAVTQTALRTRHQRKSQSPTKKSTKHSLSSPRKLSKGKSKKMAEIRAEIDEVGVDVLDDDFDDEQVGSPVLESVPYFCSEFFKIASSSPVCISIETPEHSPAVFISINAPKANGHRRSPSDCASEDSYVIFRQSYSDDSDLSMCESDESDSEGDEEDGEESDDCFCENASFRTEDGVSFDARTSQKKVRFAENLCEIHPMIKWSYAYQAARKGPWEEYARDRDRFKRKIGEVGENLTGIFDPEHRRRIYAERFAD